MRATAMRLSSCTCSNIPAVVHKCVRRHRVLETVYFPIKQQRFIFQLHLSASHHVSGDVSCIVCSQVAQRKSCLPFTRSSNFFLDKSHPSSESKTSFSTPSTVAVFLMSRSSSSKRALTRWPHCSSRARLVMQAEMPGRLACVGGKVGTVENPLVKDSQLLCICRLLYQT